MSRIRKVEISNFRCIKSFSWTPHAGVNCIVGPGDAGKSTILDAIEACLGVRRNMQFSDTDFHRLSVEAPIRITLTLGELDDTLKNLDSYGIFLRGFNKETGDLLPEPEFGAETVLTIQLVVTKDLDPVWSLFSERSESQQQPRILSWSERNRLACSRLGAVGDHDLSWRKGSVLNRVSDDRTEANAELAAVARAARQTFGDTAKSQVSGTLAIVKKAAEELGLSVGEVTALLDSQSVSLSGGTICLHDGDGVPLRGLGLGSTRLLITSLQRRAAATSSIVLVDEVEHGLEPHRIMRLITSLGAKEPSPPLQVFMTTHSPVALRELSATQLHVLRKNTSGAHVLHPVSGEDDMQATIRACPEAFLSEAVIVCEGASEMGLLRGLDLHRIQQNKPLIAARGVALADGHGETTFRRANSFVALGYRTLVLRDDDKDADATELATFNQGGGKVLQWRDKRALEQELFVSLPKAGVGQLLDQAIENLGEDLVNDHLKTASNNAINLASCRSSVNSAVRETCGKAAKAKKASWYKSVTAMELVGRNIVGPHLADSEDGFKAIVQDVFKWAGCSDE